MTDLAHEPDCFVHFLQARFWTASVQPTIRQEPQSFGSNEPLLFRVTELIRGSHNSGYLMQHCDGCFVRKPRPLERR